MSTNQINFLIQQFKLKYYRIIVISLFYLFLEKIRLKKFACALSPPPSPQKLPAIYFLLKSSKMTLNTLV